MFFVESIKNDKNPYQRSLSYLADIRMQLSAQREDIAKRFECEQRYAVNNYIFSKMIGGAFRDLFIGQKNQHEWCVMTPYMLFKYLKENGQHKEAREIRFNFVGTYFDSICLWFLKLSGISKKELSEVSLPDSYDLPVYARLGAVMWNCDTVKTEKTVLFRFIHFCPS